MAVMLRVDDELAGVAGEKEAKTKWLDTLSPYGITPGTGNKEEPTN